MHIKLLFIAYKKTYIKHCIYDFVLKYKNVIYCNIVDEAAIQMICMYKCCALKWNEIPRNTIQHKSKSSMLDLPKRNYVNTPSFVSSTKKKTTHPSRIYALSLTTHYHHHIHEIQDKRLEKTSETTQLKSQHTLAQSQSQRRLAIY